MSRRGCGARGKESGEERAEGAGETFTSANAQTYGVEDAMMLRFEVPRRCAGWRVEVRSCCLECVEDRLGCGGGRRGARRGLR